MRDKRNEVSNMKRMAIAGLLAAALALTPLSQQRAAAWGCDGLGCGGCGGGFDFGIGFSIGFNLPVRGLGCGSPPACAVRRRGRNGLSQLRLRVGCPSGDCGSYAYGGYPVAPAAPTVAPAPAYSGVQNAAYTYPAGYGYGYPNGYYAGPFLLVRPLTRRAGGGPHPGRSGGRSTAGSFRRAPSAFANAGGVVYLPPGAAGGDTPMREAGAAGKPTEARHFRWTGRRLEGMLWRFFRAGPRGRRVRFLRTERANSPMKRLLLTALAALSALSLFALSARAEAAAAAAFQPFRVTVGLNFSVSPATPAARSVSSARGISTGRWRPTSRRRPRPDIRTGPPR